MSNSETKKEKEEGFQEELKEWFVSVAKHNLGEGFKDFKKRMLLFSLDIASFKNNPLEFHVMGDAYLSFFKLGEEGQIKWLTGDVDSKLEYLSGLKEYEEAEQIAIRCFNFGDILFYTGLKKGNPIYHYAANTLLYTLTGDEPFLTQKGFSLYEMAPQTQHKPYIPKPTGHEGMFG